LAIRTLGNAIDASLVDLKGGTTGQVLAKASNTDMDFTWSAGASVPTSLGYAAGKNRIINGDMNVWQRGTSINIAAASFGYGADRWGAYVGTGAAVTISRQAFTTGAAPVAGYESNFFQRYNRTTVGSAESYLYQRMENVTTYAGQTITISFWAKVGSAVTFPIGDIYLEQNFGTGGSSAVTTNVNTSTQAISTSWTRYSFTVAVPSISGKTIGTDSQLGFVFRFPTTFSTVSFDLWGVQVEAGSTATAFQTATGTIQGELAACQRYYTRLANVGSATEYWFGSGYAGTSTQAQCILPLTTTMRSTSITLDYSGVRLQDYGAGYAISSLIYVSSARNNIVVGATSSGLTSNRPLAIDTNTTGYIGISAEL
jgi:hypothetical protein